jgi:hypothetical protein
MWKIKIYVKLVKFAASKDLIILKSFRKYVNGKKVPKLYRMVNFLLRRACPRNAISMNL